MHRCAVSYDYELQQICFTIFTWKDTVQFFRRLLGFLRDVCIFTCQPLSQLQIRQVNISGLQVLRFEMILGSQVTSIALQGSQVIEFRLIAGVHGI